MLCGEISQAIAEVETEFKQCSRRWSGRDGRTEDGYCKTSIQPNIRKSLVPSGSVSLKVST